MDKHIKKILLYAQMDLVGLLEYALGLNEHFTSDGALKTIKELQEITGESVGDALLKYGRENDLCQ